ncbi:IS66 Orf2 like protein [compost metagenome]
MMRPDAKVQTVYLYPKPVDFRKSIDGLAALVELAVFDPVLFVFLNKARNRVKILYWGRNGFCLWLKRLQAACAMSAPCAYSYWQSRQQLPGTSPKVGLGTGLPSILSRASRALFD